MPHVSDRLAYASGYIASADFQYSDDPDALYQGDSFPLSGHGAEIQLVKVLNGNYGIRRVK